MKKIIQPGWSIFSASLKNFSTSQKGRMKTSDFRPTLKADEMAPYLVLLFISFFYGEIK